jgi:hypothetical protein
LRVEIRGSGSAPFGPSIAIATLSGRGAAASINF